MCYNRKKRKEDFTMFDIKAKIEEIVNKIKGDKDLASKFQSDPIKTVEGLIGVDLPDDQIKAVVDGVKAKLGGGGIGNVVSGIGEKIGGIFGK